MVFPPPPRRGYIKSDSYPNSVGRAHAEKRKSMAFWLPRAMRSLRLIYCAASSSDTDSPTVPKSEDIAPNPPISWKPPA